MINHTTQSCASYKTFRHISYQLCNACSSCLVRLTPEASKKADQQSSSRAGDRRDLPQTERSRHGRMELCLVLANHQVASQSIQEFQLPSRLVNHHHRNSPGRTQQRSGPGRQTGTS